MEATMKQKHKTRWWRSKRKTKHHVIARSRNGQNEGNIVLISENVHKAYHVLFGNMLPEEAEAHLKNLHDKWLREARRKTF